MAEAPRPPLAEESLVVPRPGAGAPRIDGDVLFCVNPGEARRLSRLARELGGRRFFLHNSSLWRLPAGGNGCCWMCGPAVGAPMAVMLLEQLVAMGGGRFVLFGTCGALTPDLAVGDVVLPDTAVSEEGTSAHYPLAFRPAAAPALRRKLGRYLASRGVPAAQGPVWTTDAPFRETREKVAEYGEQGVLAVDMEFSALIAVAAFRGVDLAAVMVVSDLLWGGEWRPGFGDRRFRNRVRHLGDLLVEFCGESHAP